MLRTRIWMGAILIALAAAMLVLDQPYASYFPFLLLFILILSAAACLEMHLLLGSERSPPLWFSFASLLAIALSNWPAHLWLRGVDPWFLILAALTGVVLSSFLVEMARFRRPDSSVVRIAISVWMAAYLGLLPSFLIQLRWLEGADSVFSSCPRGVAALILTIFVPKMCDIGAFFTGRALGRHPMTPVLSPKKTWEGLVGGLATAMAAALIFNRIWPAMPGQDLAALGLGFTVGLAGVYGDLAESLVKRDCMKKDASRMVPGFGGVLDVVDSIIFAAPVAYCWLRWV
jgi:phosphatidate cytidylyltransferase